MEQFIGLVVPVLDYPVKGYQPGDMRVKLQAAVDQLAEECESKDFDQARALDSMFDVLQEMVGLVRQTAREQLAAIEATNVLRDRIGKANEQHLLSVYLQTTLGTCEVYRR